MGPSSPPIKEEFENVLKGCHFDIIRLKLIIPKIKIMLQYSCAADYTK
jgi:hypothetical protein